MGCFFQWIGLLWWKIWHNYATDAVGLCINTETFNAISQDRVVVAHKNQGNVVLGCDLPGDAHTTFDRHATFKGHVTGVLNSGSIGQWIAEWHTQFNNVCSTLRGGQDDIDALFRCGIAAHEIRNEDSSFLLLCLFKCLRNFQRGHVLLVCLIDNAAVCMFHSIYSFCYHFYADQSSFPSGKKTPSYTSATGK